MSPATVLPAVLALCKQAGAAILDVYRQSELTVVHKQDASPLTLADLAAHRVLVEGLGKLMPPWPVLSEESAAAAWDVRRHWQRYWLVDPLDGTKEFISRNGEFTVNVALIDQGRPVLGVVHVPVLGWTYYGIAGLGAFVERDGKLQRLQVAALSEGGTLRVVASRNHRGEQLDAWLVRMQQRFATVELVSLGSSLKICLVAEGKADIYPRLAPTCEWDTAAAQAVLEAAGGALVDVEGQPYRYNAKPELLNPWFFALGDSLQALPLVKQVS